VKINAASDSTRTVYDIITGFGSDDTLNISALISGSGYSQTKNRTLSNGQLKFVNDGTTLGAVTDNTLHFSQDSSYGVHIKYDTNSAIGTLSQSSEIYIAGFTSTIQNLTVL